MSTISESSAVEVVAPPISSTSPWNHQSALTAAHCTLQFQIEPFGGGTYHFFFLVHCALTGVEKVTLPVVMFVQSSPLLFFIISQKKLWRGWIIESEQLYFSICLHIPPLGIVTTTFVQHFFLITNPHHSSYSKDHCSFWHQSRSLFKDDLNDGFKNETSFFILCD